MSTMFYSRGKWYEARNIRNGQIPTCNIGKQRNPTSGDHIIAGLCNRGWMVSLEKLGLSLDPKGSVTAMDSRWSESVIK